jgi:uncharacterized membrane protein YkvA (DUF1232 family)
MLEKIKAKATQLKRELVALYLASRDPRTPWYAKTMIAAVVAYALSPIDLIPDFIPIFGYLDDLVLLPIGIWLAIRMIPPEILQDCRERAATADFQLPRNWQAAGAIFFLWVTALILILYFVMVKPAIDSPSDARLGY